MMCVFGDEQPLDHHLDTSRKRDGGTRHGRSRRHPIDQRAGRDILCDHRARARPRAVAQRHGRDHPEAELSGACEQIRQLAASLEERSSVPAIMGVEGQGSAVYFGVLGRCLRQEGIAFTERNRRPPRDPVNALLSLGYMLVLGEVMTTLQAAGLHRGLGFLHEVANRRPALALDVLETLREPLVDRLTLSVFNHGVFGPTDFNPQPDGGVRLKPESLRRYLPLYERTLTTNFRHPRDGHSVNFRTLLREDVGTLKAAIREHLVWKPTHLEL